METGHPSTQAFNSGSGNRALVINPAAGCHHFPLGLRLGYLPSHRASLTLAGTKLYCVVTEACVCEQLAQSCYMRVDHLGIELDRETLPQPLHHHATKDCLEHLFSQVMVTISQLHHNHHHVWLTSNSLVLNIYRKLTVIRKYTDSYLLIASCCSLSN